MTTDLAQFQLSPIETRILGSLLEKEKTTPEVYPLTLNSLTTACNQLSNREPVVDYDERVVRHGLDRLRQKKLVFEVRGAGSRVEKFRHALRDHFELSDADVAVLCILMLRGAQTVGEVRTRTERLHAFASLEEVDACLHALLERPQPLVRVVPPRVGQKESRYVQLLSVETEMETPAPEKRQTVLVDESRLESVEAELQNLRQELQALREEFLRFRKQFES